MVCLRYFSRLRDTKGITEWLQPLSGCERCGYVYEREPGYFMPAIWVINYAVVSGLGLFLCLTLEYFFSITLRQQIIFIILPMPIFSLLIVRHAKAYFLAIDHFFNPCGKR